MEITPEQKLIKAQDEYIKFLGEYIGSLTGYLHSHRMLPSKKITDKGAKLRKKITDTKKQVDER